MPYLLIHHTVQDYSKWKTAFDEHASARGGGGSKGGYLFQNPQDPNEVVILLEWDSLDNARQFAESDDLRQTMERAGVSGPPHIHYLELTERPSA